MADLERSERYLQLFEKIPRLHFSISRNLSMQFRPSKNLFIHIDCDCFFASCEMMRDPSIRDKCVCVGGDIVLTSNYRARKYGVKLGTPGWEVENMIPKGELVMLPPDLALYGDVSDRMNAYLANWSNRVDIFGIDESWMEVTGIPECLGLGYEDFLLKVQNDLLDQVGVPASVGLSNTRLRAKILGEVYKPLGRAVGPSSDTFFSHAVSLHFSKIPFIGRRLQDRLRYYV